MSMEMREGDGDHNPPLEPHPNPNPKLRLNPNPNPKLHLNPNPSLKLHLDPNPTLNPRRKAWRHRGGGLGGHARTAGARGGTGVEMKVRLCRAAFAHSQSSDALEPYPQSL